MEYIPDFFKAFFVGGILCAIGQLLIDTTRLTPGKILVMYVVAGVFLGGVGLYGPIVDWAGAGATIPLTGFGYAITQGVKEAIAQKGALGILTGPLTSGSAGITAAVLCGLIASLVSRPHEK